MKVLVTGAAGRIAAVFQLPLAYPRDSTSTEFFRISSMITKEFLSLDRESNAADSEQRGEA